MHEVTIPTVTVVSKKPITPSVAKLVKKVAESQPYIMEKDNTSETSCSCDMSPCECGGTEPAVVSDKDMKQYMCDVLRGHIDLMFLTKDLSHLDAAMKQLKQFKEDFAEQIGLDETDEYAESEEETAEEEAPKEMDDDEKMEVLFGMKRVV